MKLELDLNPLQNATQNNQLDTDSVPLDVKKMLRSGINFAKEGNRVEARQMLLGVTDAEPDNETAWLWLASISEYPEELLVFLQNVLKVNPNNERALEWAKQTKTLLSKTFVQRGISAAQNSQSDFAKQCFLQGIVHDSENEMAWLWLASIADTQEEKVSHLSQVLRLNPENETALNSLNAMKGNQAQDLLKKANSAAVAGDHASAHELLATILKTSPNMEEAWVLKAFLATDFHEKIECYKRALELNSECEAAQAGLSSLQMLMPKTANSVESAEIATAPELEPVSELEAPEKEVSPIAEAVSVEPVAELKQVEFGVHQEPSPEAIAFAEEVTEEEIHVDLVSLPEPETFVQPTAEAVVVVDADAEKERQAVAFSQQLTEKIRPYKEDELDKLVEDAHAEFSQEQPLPESRAVAEEVYYVREEAEQSIHETHNGFKEDFTHPVARESADETFFELDDLSSPSDATVDQVLDIEQTSTKSTQELDGEVAEKAAVEFGVSSDEPVLEVDSSPLEDFYSEPVAEEPNQAFVAEKSPSGPLKKEVRVTETYVTEVESNEIYSSEFFANDGFVLVPQNDPFAESKVVEETVAESAEVAPEQVAEEAETVAEAPAEMLETAQTEAVEEVLETEAEEPQAVLETETAQEPEEVEVQTEEPVEAHSPEPVEAETDEEVQEVQSENAEEFLEPAKSDESVEPVQFEQAAEVADQVEPAAELSEQKEEYAQMVSEIESIGATSNLTECPFCAAQNDNQVVCGSCDAMLSLADMEALISHPGVNQEMLLQAIERMEVEKSLREFNADELTFLAIANLNAKNLEKGLGYLQEASALKPNDIVLPSKIKFLMAHLEELKDNRFRNAENQSGNRTILVVDDSPTVRKLIAGKLEKCGHSVLAAVDGMDALAKINEVIPDLILLDITMPRLDGYQVCKLIRNNEMTKDVPIVMISGKDGFFDKVRGRMAGSSGYITKPFGPDTLMKTLETYFG